MQNKSIVTANALAVTVAISYTACRILVALFPELFLVIAQSWFHGLEVNTIGSWNLSLSSFVIGIISATISAWVIGYMYAVIHWYFASKS